MKSLTSILLSFAILLQSFGSLIIVVGYKINQETITELFCINKNKPVLHCNGKCYLQNQLNEEQKRDQLPVSKIKDKQQPTQFFQKTYFNSSAVIVVNDFSLPNYVQPCFQEIQHSIFQPPG